MIPLNTATRIGAILTLGVGLAFGVGGSAAAETGASIYPLQLADARIDAAGARPSRQTVTVARPPMTAGGVGTVYPLFQAPVQLAAVAPDPATAIESDPALGPDGSSVITTHRFVSLVGGAVLSALAAEAVFDVGGPWAIVLATAGMVIGDWWYKNELWPFGPASQPVAASQPAPGAPIAPPASDGTGLISMLR